MRAGRWLLLVGVLLAVVVFVDYPAAQVPSVAFHGTGTTGTVRDATRVGSVIYAVGTFSNASAGGRTDGALWTLDGVSPPVRTPLPDLCTTTCGSQNLQAGEAITPDGAYIVSQARTGGTAAAAVTGVRVARNSLLNLNLTPTVPVNPKLPRTISDDGSILYGNVGVQPAGTTAFQARAVRFDLNAGTTTQIYPQPAQNASGFSIFQSVLQRGASSDGSVVVGQSFSNAPQVDAQAFRYVHNQGVSNIPRLPGGTFNTPIALNGDGNIVVVLGNSADSPATSRPYIYNALTGTITELGVPNAAFAFRGNAGITDDGAVVVATLAGSCVQPCTPDTYAYFHNSHGWFHLASALGAAGVDLSEWGELAAISISGDGTLVWGAGVHNGAQEGFVAELPPDYLESFNPQPSPPANTSLVGAWSEDDLGAESHFIVFTADGAYYQIEDENGGFERGYYTYDGTALTITTLLDTNGSSGISDLNGIPFPINADTFGSLHRIEGSPGSIVGAWVGGNPTVTDSSLVSVFTASTYGSAFDFEEDASETGTYTWDSVTSVLNVFPTGGVADTGNLVTLSPNGLTAHVVGDDGEEFDAARVIDPATIPVVANTPLSASGLVGQAFSYYVTATNTVAFTATGLPEGLSIGSNGEISGTPTVGGQFSVSVFATNAVGVSDIEALTLTIAIPTPVGRNVVVEPTVPEGQGPITLSFGEITAAGTTSVTVLDPDESGVPLPGNVEVGGVIYDVHTTASYTGLITLCFSYGGIDFGSTTPRLFHYENNAWVDITTSVDPATQTICGATTTLSPFAVLASRVVRTGFYAPVNAIAGVLNSVKGGATVPLKFNVYVDGIEQTTTAGLFPTLQTVPCDSTAPEDPVDFTIAGGTSLRYDTTAGYFIQNWKVPKAPGCYMLRMTTSQDGLALTARFKVR